jgi:DNA-binding transcriptional MerR regulator
MGACCIAHPQTGQVLAKDRTTHFSRHTDVVVLECLYIYIDSVLIKCMKSDLTNSTPSYPLADLCVLVDMPVRSIRYYVQIGLVDRPEGETRAARYGARHLEQLLLIKKWTAAGVSLDRIRELLHGEEAPVPARARKAGSIEVCSHLCITDGLEIVIEPSRAQMTPEQVRHFTRGVMTLYLSVVQADVPTNPEDPARTATLVDNTIKAGSKK